MSRYLFIVTLIFSAWSNELIAQTPGSITAKTLVNEHIFDTADFASCHASTLVALPGNRIMAAWFGGPFESHKEVSIWMSVRTAGKWEKPREIANGLTADSNRYACWNPVLFRNREGTVFLFYKVGKSPREWWGMMKKSHDQGKTWSAAEKLPEDFLGPIKNKPVQLKDGSVLHPSSTESLDNKSWTIHIERTDKDMSSWQKINIDCDSFDVIQPSILFHSGNRLQLLCRSKQNYIVESWSHNNGENWSELRKTTLANPNSGSDAVTLADGRQLLVYNPLAAGREWYEGRNILKLAISPDGQHWTDLMTLEEHSSGEYSYPAIIQSTDGRVHISYTAARKKIKYVVLELR